MKIQITLSDGQYRVELDGGKKLTSTKTEDLAAFRQRVQNIVEVDYMEACEFHEEVLNDPLADDTISKGSEDTPKPKTPTKRKAAKKKKAATNPEVENLVDRTKLDKAEEGVKSAEYDYEGTKAAAEAAKKEYEALKTNVRIFSEKLRKAKHKLTIEKAAYAVQVQKQKNDAALQKLKEKLAEAKSKD